MEMNCVSGPEISSVWCFWMHSAWWHVQEEHWTAHIYCLLLPHISLWACLKIRHNLWCIKKQGMCSRVVHCEIKAQQDIDLKKSVHAISKFILRCFFADCCRCLIIITSCLEGRFFSHFSFTLPTKPFGRIDFNDFNNNNNNNTDTVVTTTQRLSSYIF